MFSAPKLEHFVNEISIKTLSTLLCKYQVNPQGSPWDRVGDFPVFCARGVGHLPFIFAWGQGHLSLT